MKIEIYRDEVSIVVRAVGQGLSSNFTVLSPAIRVKELGHPSTRLVLKEIESAVNELLSRREVRERL